ncbi:MAG: MerR family transcriptional regulator [Alphaproteobacteria bacterium]
MIKKSPEAYRTIGEASSEIGVPTYVLRFWETKFKQVKLIKRPGGRRFYKPEGY